MALNRILAPTLFLASVALLVSIQTAGCGSPASALVRNDLDVPVEFGIVRHAAHTFPPRSTVFLEKNFAFGGLREGDEAMLAAQGEKPTYTAISAADAERAWNDDFRAYLLVI